VSWLLRHAVRRAGRSLWENLYLNAVSTGVVAAALLLFGVYLSVQVNVDHIVDTWDRDVHIAAYFQGGVPEARRFALRDAVAARPEVQAVRYVSEADAAAWLRDEVAGVAPVLDELGPGALPASLEITLSDAHSEPTAIAAFVASLQGPDFADLDYGQEWVERFNAFLSLLQLLGAVLGLLILLSALFLVYNTVHLVVYNRRDEVEIQKLVGATEGFVLAPFLLEGLAQGLAGGLLAVGGLWLVQGLVVVRLRDALDLQLAGELALLPGSWLAGIVAIGVAVGVGAAGLAVHRFLRTAP
jgi:cell division transport system permease protein